MLFDKPFLCVFEMVFYVLLFLFCEVYECIFFLRNVVPTVVLPTVCRSTYLGFFFSAVSRLRVFLRRAFSVSDLCHVFFGRLISPFSCVGLLSFFSLFPMLL